MRPPSTHPSTLLLITVLAIATQAVVSRATGSPSASGAIYRCGGENGIPGFSQFPCRALDRSAGRVDLDPLQVVRVPALDAAERRRLDILERERLTRSQARARAQRRARNESRRSQRLQIEHCRAARAGLDALQVERRKGYSLRRARELERREAELDASVRENC